ncbi:MAG: tetraacyldisaccharide 4'-kinase [Syntrophales bacterium]|jgi:tetraacyldisaccharide 4'-kinase|nr:tetraacyldisaccharide 4'-kinase [Syntrophales bacterium]MCK9392898.1 tetraacyldisaccharide 4'-kinase [Syntrophales bacterium]
MKNLHTKLGSYWYPEGPLAPIHPFLITMMPFSFAYGAIVALRNQLYDRSILKQVKLSCPVISIGNITAGGTGKTPMTVLTANGLKAHGFRPAVLSRGYGGRLTTSGNVVSDGASILLSPEEAGDEPVLIATAAPGIPVVTGPDRCISGKLAIEKFGADVLVLDDALQHRRLFRDVNIVLLDEDRPFGNGRLLPAGPLRESPAALNRADVIVETGISKGENGRKKPDVPDSIPVFRAHYQPLEIIRGNDNKILPPDLLQGKKLFAFTGIAAPDKFHTTLEELGAKIIKFLAFPDHYFYKQGDVQAIAGDAKTLNAEMLITTEKDGVKLLKFQDFYQKIFILRVGLRMDPDEKTFLSTLINLLKR